MCRSSIKNFKAYLRRNNTVCDIIISDDLLNILRNWCALDNPDKYHFYFWRTPNKRITFTFKQVIESKDFVQDIMDHYNPKWKPLHLKNKFSGNYVTVEYFKRDVNSAISSLYELHRAQLNTPITPIRQAAQNYKNIQSVLTAVVNAGNDLNKAELHLQQLAFRLLDEKIAECMPVIINQLTLKTIK